MDESKLPPGWLPGDPVPTEAWTVSPEPASPAWPDGTRELRVRQILNDGVEVAETVRLILADEFALIWPEDPRPIYVREALRELDEWIAQRPQYIPTSPPDVRWYVYTNGAWRREKRESDNAC